MTAPKFEEDAEEVIKRIAFEQGRRTTGIRTYLIAKPIITTALQAAYAQGISDLEDKIKAEGDHFAYERGQAYVQLTFKQLREMVNAIRGAK